MDVLGHGLPAGELAGLTHPRPGTVRAALSGCGDEDQEPDAYGAGKVPAGEQSRKAAHHPHYQLRRLRNH